MKVDSVQVLVATMMQADRSLLERLNIQSDAIVCNQCDEVGCERFTIGGNEITWYNFAERGVGLNRNNALLRATADICVIADDDMRFDEGYREVVLDTFNRNPKADVVIFNVKEQVIRRKVTSREHFTRKCGYGAARLAFRREAIHRNGISFNVCFGGGAKFSSGEDVLFLSECNRKGLKVLAVPRSIAELTENRPSTWFQGYNDKFFFDQGILLKAMGRRWRRLIAVKAAYGFSRKAEPGKKARVFRSVFSNYLKGMDSFDDYSF